ncbi:hypothetical protein PAMP_020653 [Pampus punctatissimus]
MNAELSEAAQTELLNLCEEQFAQLEKFQNEIILSQPDVCDNPQEQLTHDQLCASHDVRTVVQSGAAAASALEFLWAEKGFRFRVFSDPTRRRSLL